MTETSKRHSGYWPDTYVSKRRSASSAIRRIRRGQRVFIGSSCGEPQALVRELAAQFRNFSDLEIVRVLSLESTPLTDIADDTASRSFNIRSFYLGVPNPVPCHETNGLSLPLIFPLYHGFSRAGSFPYTWPLFRCLSRMISVG